MNVKSALVNTVFFLVTLAVGLAAVEVVLRVRNADQKNYNIEMWRYAKLLKVRSADPELGHEHRPGTEARLQNVRVRINSLGMRGPEPDLSDPSKKKVLLLGSSNTLGWGVPEEETMAAALQSALGEKAVVLNAGIGNYNAFRYVSLYEKRLRRLKPDVVVIHYFIRDAETLEAGGGNWLLRNSQLAVMLNILTHDLGYSRKGASGLIDHYQAMYAPGSRGLSDMLGAMRRLDELSKEEGFKVIVAMVPDIHAVEPYPFGFVHDAVREIADGYGWRFVDLGPALWRVPQPDLWVMPGDPHINGRGQRIMAETLLPELL